MKKCFIFQTDEPRNVNLTAPFKRRGKIYKLISWNLRADKIRIHRLSKIYSYRQPFLVFLSSSPFLRALKMIKFRNGPSDTRVPDWTSHPCDLNKRFARIFVPPRIWGSLWCTLISIRNIYPQILKVVSPLAFLYIC